MNGLEIVEFIWQLIFCSSVYLLSYSIKPSERLSGCNVEFVRFLNHCVNIEHDLLAIATQQITNFRGEKKTDSITFQVVALYSELSFHREIDKRKILLWNKRPSASPLIERTRGLENAKLGIENRSLSSERMSCSFTFLYRQMVQIH